MPINRTWYSALVDDTGDNLSGTQIDKADFDTLLDDVDAAFTDIPGTSAPTTTGTQTALAIPTGTGDLVLYLNNATLLTLQGIVAGLSGQRLTLISKGAGQVDLAHLHASGTALGKLKLFATSGLTSLAAGSGVAVFQYDATVTQWRLVSHEQGAWITPTFAAGDFTGSGSMTWTVDSGDVATNAYHLSGRTLTYTLWVDTTSVGGTPAASLQVLIPAGLLAANYQSFIAARVVDSGTLNVGASVSVAPAGSLLQVNRHDEAAFTAATNTTRVRFTVQVHVQ